MAHDLTIRLEGRDGGVPAERLLEALQHTLHILRGLDARNSEDGKPGLRWHVARATTSSPLTLTLAPRVVPGRRDNSREVGRALVRGLRKLESGRGVPSDFPDDALREARSLVGLLGRGVSRVEFSVPGEQVVAPTLHAAARIDAFFGRRPGYHKDDTTVEGSLETVTIHGGEAFDVFDGLTGTKVRCILSEGALKEAIATLGRRVAVTGRATFNDRGRPVSIEVASIRLLREGSDLPQASDFEGDGRVDITGGLESSEFIRKMRDA